MDSTSSTEIGISVLTQCSSSSFVRSFVRRPRCCALAMSHYSIPHEKGDQRGHRDQMKQGMKSVRCHSIAAGQERVGAREDNLIAGGPLRVRYNQVRYPPGTQHADDEHAISNPE